MKWTKIVAGSYRSGKYHVWRRTGIDGVIWTASHGSEELSTWCSTKAQAVSVCEEHHEG